MTDIFLSAVYRLEKNNRIHPRSLHSARVTGGIGSMLLMVSTLLILGLLAFVEYRNFKKWINPGQETQ